jgi:hypothetical protein
VEAEKARRVEREDDPRRCPTVTALGQCMLMKTEGQEHCPMHSGRAIAAVPARALNNYRIQKFNTRLEELVNSGGIKSLRDEIAILRMLIEERVNFCKDSHDLILASGPISDLATRLEKLVTSCHKLEGSMGELMDKQALMHFATRVVDIITEEIQNDILIEKISDRILAAMAEKNTVNLDAL